MIKLFKNIEDIKSQGFELVRYNDVFFDSFSCYECDLKIASRILREIDGVELIDRFSFYSKFDGTRLNISLLSSGCKTAVNVITYPSKVFSLEECGSNAGMTILSGDNGMVYAPKPVVYFDGCGILACEDGTFREISTGLELERWWSNESH